MLVKDVQRHPVRGEAMHVDFLRVDMKVAIQTVVTLELTGADHAPGVVEGGVLSQGAIELHIEALPGDIPDSIVFDVSGLEMNSTATLSQLTAPPGVTLLDDPDETVLATITPPTQEPVEEEIETETELVGEGEARRRARARATPARRASSRPPTSPEALLLRTGRLARRRPRQSRQPLRRHAAQRGLPGRRRADRALGPAEAEEEVRAAS